MKKIIALAILALPVLTGCDIIRVAEYTHRFDADGDDIVEVVMDESVPGSDDRCLDMGGVPQTDAHGVRICWNVDK